MDIFQHTILIFPLGQKYWIIKSISFIVSMKLFTVTVFRPLYDDYGLNDEQQ